MSFNEFIKNIPNDWEIVTLPEVIEFMVDNRGKSVPTVPDGIPLIATNCIRNECLYPIKDKVRYVSEDIYNNWFKSHPQPNDIIFVNKGTPGKVCLVPSNIDFCFAQDMIALRPNEKIYYGYLLACLRSDFFQEQIKNYSVGTMIPHCRKGDLEKLILPLPPMNIQKDIGKIYLTFSNKVELNNEMNKTLEEMSQSIFKRWFVDFEFRNEDGEPYKSSGGEMVESELGMIPKGWEVRTIDDITELIIDYRGKTPKKLGYDWSETGIMAISAKNIKNNKLVNLDVAKYVSDELYEKWMKDKLKSGDVLMTSEAPLGELYYLADDTKYCLSQRVYALRSNEDIMKKSLFYYMISSNNVMGDIMNRATGTTVVGIRQVELRKVKIIVPCIELQNKFDNLINNILIKINKSEKENEKLANLRDTLLPKLMSGEIRVPIK